MGKKHGQGFENYLKVSINGAMDRCSSVTGLIIKYKAKDYILGMIIENMMVSG
jgi:hypothetical protein